MKLDHALYFRVRVLGLTALIVATADGVARATNNSFIGPFDTITTISTTVPTNGDVNPYGVARVPRSKGSLVEGRFLISNFNNGANQQGTGTTIVQIAPNGTFSLFARIDASKVSCPGGVGLTTALVALRSGFVIVGSLPTTDGTAATAQAGCLIILDSEGNVVETLSGHHINGPWDMTAVDGGRLVALVVDERAQRHGSRKTVTLCVAERSFVYCWVHSDGRPPQLLDSTIIASGLPERTDPAALVIGPTGVAFDDDTGICMLQTAWKIGLRGFPTLCFAGARRILASQ